MFEVVHLDFETRSTTDLPKAGLHRYAEDPNTRPWCLCFRFDNGPVQTWKWGDPEPVELIAHVARGGKVKAHNTAFERWIWNRVMRRYYPHWPEMTIEQMDCTMARAAAISHPQGLEALAAALQAPVRKDMEGNTVMRQLMRPRQFLPDGRIVWWDDAAKIDRLTQYCSTDVLTECAVDEMIPPLTDSELKVWHLDQRINDRGIYIDLKAVKEYVTVVELAKKDADRVMRRLTNGAVPKCTNDGKIIEWIAAQGVPCTTVKKGEHDELRFLADIHDAPTVKDVINLRADSKKTSTAKYKTMLGCVCADGRIRGTLNYHGAGPGRWAGRLIQPQNFPRMDPDEDESYIFNWLAGLADSGVGPKDIYDMMTAVHGDAGESSPLKLLSRALRSTIMAAPGNKLVGGDFANIEGRINAWNAGEKWKLEAFLMYDMGIGPDLYKITASGITGKRVEDVIGKERQAQGKVPELACGYQGGVGAFITMGDNYDLDPFEVARTVVANTSSEAWDEVAATYTKAKDKHGLQEREWTAIKLIVNKWRKTNPNIVQSWWDLQDAAVAAVSTPGTVFKVTRVSYFSDGRCLWCVLPSGRMICYAYPEIITTYEERHRADGTLYLREKHTVHFWGYKDGRWMKLSLYGGLQCENIVQGMARDVMVDRMFAAEDCGYPLILTVHDELLAEVAASQLDLNAEHLESVMSILPTWAEGLPLAAKAWEDVRYVK